MYRSTASALSNGGRFDEGNPESKFMERGLFKVCSLLGKTPGAWNCKLHPYTLDKLFKCSELRPWIRAHEQTCSGLCGFMVTPTEEVPSGKIVVTEVGGKEMFLIEDVVID